MFWKKTGRYWRIGFRSIHRKFGGGCFGICFLLLLTGIWDCGGRERTEAGDTPGLAGGNPGYLLADSRNQRNFIGKDQAERFIRKVEEQKPGGMTVVVLGEDSFTRYRCKTLEGRVQVEECYVSLGREGYEERSRTEYQADFWEYTEGYLFFGRSFMPGYDGPSECTALRLAPMEERWMEWNREYLLETGYERNNLFFQNWSEKDYGDVDFYDLFDAWYASVYQETFPYPPDENCNVGAVYRIPAEEFESVIGSHLSVDIETLRSKTRYFAEDQTYEYRPRGLYDCEITSLYPEVTGGWENEDGTLTLTVRAVDPKERKAAAFTHRVVVRPMEAGGFRYVSNQILLPEELPEKGWYRGRLTEEEWEEYYGAEDR